MPKAAKTRTENQLFPRKQFRNAVWVPKRERSKTPAEFPEHSLGAGPHHWGVCVCLCFRLLPRFSGLKRTHFGRGSGDRGGLCRPALIRSTKSFLRWFSLYVPARSSPRAFFHPKLSFVVFFLFFFKVNKLIAPRRQKDSAPWLSNLKFPPEGNYQRRRRKPTEAGSWPGVIAEGSPARRGPRGLGLRERGRGEGTTRKRPREART